MSLTQSTAPEAEPLTLEEAKNYLRIEPELGDDDELINELIAVVREMAEVQTNRQLMQAGYQYKIDRFAGVIQMPKPPLVSVTSIKYLDDNGDLQTVDAAVYDVDTDSVPGQVRLAYGQSWPSHRWQPQAITIEYLCGHSAGDGSVPDPDVYKRIKLWMMMQIANYYEHREEYITGTIVANIPLADRLIWSAKVPVLT